MSPRRVARPVRGQVKATCAHKPCSKPFEYEWPTTNRRFCSIRCRRSAARFRELARLLEMAAQRANQPDETAALADEVARECLAALANFSALVAEQEVGRDARTHRASGSPTRRVGTIILASGRVVTVNHGQDFAGLIRASQESW